ncbi:hypothetical protein HMPREF9413_4540 [Paenibacillus sp. HGF7]|nr:hypothetical protein HMPREF9413_4540 [Paenibacillus sp. HGF7]
MREQARYFLANTNKKRASAYRQKAASSGLEGRFFILAALNRY